MTSRERVWAALAGREVDRPPVSFWGHVYHRESDARELAEATLESWRRYRWDWVKLNPRKHYHVEPWGVRYRYPGVPDAKPRLEAWPVRAPADWARITPRPPDAGALGEQLEAVRLLRRALPDDVPLIETVFTPLAVLGEMVETPQELRAHLDSHPDLVRGALEAVTATFAPFVRELLRAGADGIYLATVDWASADLLTPGLHRAWSRPWDLRVLAAAAAAPFNVLHVCGRRNLLFELGDYPVAAFSWAATDPRTRRWPRARPLGAAVMGGISHDGALLAGDAAAVLAEYEAGLRAHRRTALAGRAGLLDRAATPPANLSAVRDAVASTQLPSPPAQRPHADSSSNREVRHEACDLRAVPAAGGGGGCPPTEVTKTATPTVRAARPEAPDLARAGALGGHEARSTWARSHPTSSSTARRAARCGWRISRATGCSSSSPTAARDLAPLHEIEPRLRQLGVKPYGICGDKAYTLVSFARQRQLPFVLLADVTGEVSQLYGLRDSRTLQIRPGFVLINRQGVVRMALLGQALPYDEMLALVESAVTELP